MRTYPAIALAAAAAFAGAPHLAAAQPLASTPMMRAAGPLNSAAGASQAAQPRIGVTAAGQAADVAFDAVGYSPLSVDGVVRAPNGERIGVITQVIARDGANEAYAMVKTAGGRMKVPASQLRASFGDYVLQPGSGRAAYGG